jgi:hypothetical protein
MKEGVAWGGVAWRGRRTLTTHGAREGRRIGLGRGWSGVVGGGGVGVRCRRDEREGGGVEAGVGDEALELGLERAEAARVRRLQLGQLFARHLRHPRPARRRHRRRPPERVEKRTEEGAHRRRERAAATSPPNHGHGGNRMRVADGLM